jgi:hypothetical protein
MTTTNTPLNNNTFALFEGRHELPLNRGAIFGPTDNPLNAAMSEAGELALGLFAIGQAIRVLVTGATPALTQFVGHCIRAQMAGAMGSLVLLHFDRAAGEYLPEVLIGHDHCAPNSTHTNPMQDGCGWVAEHADMGDAPTIWDGNPRSLTPSEWGQWCAIRRTWDNPRATHDVLFSIGVANGSIDPHDCE